MKHNILILFLTASLFQACNKKAEKHTIYSENSELVKELTKELEK